MSHTLRRGAGQHPFEDGNGRIHRFLLHNILARRGFTPEGVMFPVSAVMARRGIEYDASLEDFSRPLMALARFSLDDEGRLAAHGDLTPWFRSIDLTAQTEALCRFMEATLDTELAHELAFLTGYDACRTALREIVDMPDRAVDLFIRLCLQNGGRLSARKRDEHFATLTGTELAEMERAVRAAFPPPG